MVIRLEDTRKAEPLFAGWEETLIRSCLQKIMGSVYVTDAQAPRSAAACAALILHCLDAGLYPSWDAQNRNSVRLAQKLGYEFSHEYPAYELWDL